MATTDKYDRQLRLWGAHGQRALMEAKVCVLGSSPCATETMKNLVLPGIGDFVIVDSATVEAQDLGHNWFLEEGDKGQPRAEAVCRQLLEMNPDVKGSHIVKEPAKAVAEGANFFRPFSIVIATQLPEQTAAALGKVCEELAIPLVWIVSVGFVGKIRLFVSEHTVCETKPDSEFGDLRLTAPFPELRAFVDSIDVASCDVAQHAHVPYVVILIKAIDEWQKLNAGKELPKTREEKDAFRSIISSGQRNPQEGNFDEALDNAYKATVPYSIPDGVKDALELQTKNEKSEFWVIAKAVAAFVKDQGKLPLAGSLPDMTASTEWYVKLQEIYGSKAEADCAAIQANIASIVKEQGLAAESISVEAIKRFCQHAQQVEVFKLRTLEQEQRPCSMEDGGIDLEEENGDEDSLIQWYVALRAADAFRQERSAWPGGSCGDKDEAALAGELAALTALAAKVLEPYKVEGFTADSKMLEEIVRYGGCELHTTSSVLGGIASQEAVKLVTRQYSPMNNTLIFDGVRGKMQVLEL